MANDTSVIVPIEADNRPLKQTLTDTTGAIERESRKWDSATGSAAQGMEGKMTSMFKAISAAAIAAKVGQTLLEWGKDAIAAASDLEEVQNVVDVTFGDSANQINAWAKNAISQFGLTETKAKQFASTLGAMMKSAGMSGPEIVKMSEDLSGLAADMASFYNLDFDTAFQKIRSGISGETEPLKQLGINMNVANLNAFALQQGLTKTFEKMSQGEQTMLRYQYLMQATADAQGDFARTSDGYANGLRLLESNIESIKTTVGNMLIPILASATSGLNAFLSSLTQTKPRTVLDDFADIDLKTEEKLAQIQKTAEEANVLIGTLSDISGKVSSAGQTSGLVSFVNSFSGSLTDLTGALSAARDGNVTGMIDALAEQLAKDVGGDADHWKKLLTTISENLYKVNGAVMWDGNATANWLDAAAEAAESLGGDYSGYWDDLLSVLGDKAGDAVIALAKATNPGEIMKGIAEAANVLGSNSPALWSSLLESLKKVDGLQNLFSDSNAAGNVASLADALSGNAPDTSKAEAWKTFLSALSDNADAFSALTKTSPEETKTWLSEIATAANELDPENAEGWNKLLQNFITGLPGLSDTGAGKEFFDALSLNFLAMGTESDQAKAGLAALGLSTDQITDKQNVWLETCKRLVQTIPELSGIVNVQTGEVKGGTEAVREYVKAWEEGQTKLAMIKALQEKESAIEARFADLPGLQKGNNDLLCLTRPDVIAEEGISIRAVKRMYGELSGNPDHGLSPKDIFEIAEGVKEGDMEAAKGAFAQLGAALGDVIAMTVSIIDGLVVIGGGLSGAYKYIKDSMFESIRGKMKRLNGEEINKLASKVYDLDDKEELRQFLKGEQRQLKIYNSEIEVTYDPQKRIGVSLSKIGANKAVSLGAYAFALHQLSR